MNKEKINIKILIPASIGTCKTIVEKTQKRKRNK